ncbi:hypothetical protein [Escherichia phage vB_EcoM_JNE01]|nr:hypothetical protein [Escherichia phage vB_EcoM_JNE01]
MSYEMFLDDIRNPGYYYPGRSMVVCRDFKSACKQVEKFGIPSFISFDHDLGDMNYDEKTGYSFAKWIIDYMFEHEIKTPFAFHVHSSNPVGKVNIEHYLNNAFENL